MRVRTRAGQQRNLEGRNRKKNELVEVVSVLILSVFCTMHIILRPVSNAYALNEDDALYSAGSMMKLMKNSLFCAFDPLTLP
jgi:hypothetical protein